MCNAPKYGEVEERTGYGGGYNDRGVVEYIERQDSDDEYDEVISVCRWASYVRTFLVYYIVQVLSMKHNLSVRPQSKRMPGRLFGPKKKEVRDGW
jgi:hypothetical protein